MKKIILIAMLVAFASAATYRTAFSVPSIFCGIVDNIGTNYNFYGDEDC